MFVIDLKLAGFLLLSLLFSVGYLSLLLVSRRKRPSSPAVEVMKQAETTVLEENLDAAPVGLLVYDAAGQQQYANKAAQALLDESWLAPLETAVRNLSTTPEVRQFSQSAEKGVRCWLCPVGSGTLVLLLDQSELWRTSRASLLLLSSLSHELRTPITAVLAHLEVLQSADLPPETHDNSLRLIHKETQRISRLVQNLLQLSRLQSRTELELRPVNLLLIAEEAIAELILVAEEKQIQLTLEAETNLPLVVGNADRLKQVLLNLLDNAIKYCRAGDEVWLRLQKTAAAVSLTVEDSGPGIAAHHLPHVQEKLYRARTDVEGSGLGLAIVGEILRWHESELHIESPEQGGTAVRFSLPQAHL